MRGGYFDEEDRISREMHSSGPEPLPQQEDKTQQISYAFYSELRGFKEHMSRLAIYCCGIGCTAILIFLIWLSVQTAELDAVRRSPYEKLHSSSSGHKALFVDAEYLVLRTTAGGGDFVPPPDVGSSDLLSSTSKKKRLIESSVQYIGGVLLEGIRDGSDYVELLAHRRASEGTMSLDAILKMAEAPTPPDRSGCLYHPGLSLQRGDPGKGMAQWYFSSDKCPPYRLGVNSADPNAELDVRGSANISGTLSVAGDVISKACASASICALEARIATLEARLALLEAKVGGV